MIKVDRNELAEYLGVAPERLTVTLVEDEPPMIAVDVRLDGKRVRPESEEGAKVKAFMTEKVRALGLRSIAAELPIDVVKEIRALINASTDAYYIGLLSHATGKTAAELTALKEFVMRASGPDRFRALLTEMAAKNDHVLDWIEIAPGKGHYPQLTCPSDEKPS
jgi:hypothetical protein